MKFTNYSFIFVFLFCFILFCCAPPQEEVMDLAQVRKAIEDGGLKFMEAVRQGDAAAVAALYTEDATLLPPDAEMIMGREGIEEFWSGVIQMGLKDAVFNIVDVFGSGDLAYEISNFTLTIQPEGQEAIEQKGKYVLVWKQTADGSWKLHVDIFNYTMPAK